MNYSFYTLIYDNFENIDKKTSLCLDACGFEKKNQANNSSKNAIIYLYIAIVDKPR